MKPGRTAFALSLFLLSHIVRDAMTTTEVVSSGTYSWQRQVQVSVPPNWKRFLLMLPILYAIDLGFYSLMGFISQWVPIYPVELIRNAAIAYAVLSWTPVVLALSAGEGVTKWDSAIYGAYINFCIFACFQGTSLVFFETYRQLNWWTPVLDTIWGTFSGGLTCLLTHILWDRCCGWRKMDTAETPKAGAV